MTSSVAPAAGRAVPGGALFALAIGILLYATTSLVLGPSGTRVFDVSLSLPSIEVAPVVPTTISRDAITGSRLMQAAAVRAQAVVAAETIRPIVQAAGSPASAASSHAPLKAEVPAAKPHSVAAKRSHYHDADERSHRLARRR